MQRFGKFGVGDRVRVARKGTVLSGVEGEVKTTYYTIGDAYQNEPVLVAFGNGGQCRFADSDLEMVKMAALQHRLIEPHKLLLENYEFQEQILDCIRRALAKLDADTFGVCERCGGRIGSLYLWAVPFEVWCQECVRAHPDEARQRFESGSQSLGEEVDHDTQHSEGDLLRYG